MSDTATPPTARRVIAVVGWLACMLTVVVFVSVGLILLVVAYGFGPIADDPPVLARILYDREHEPPAGTHPDLIAALISPDDLEDVWVGSAVGDENIDYGPDLPCQPYYLISEWNIRDAASVSLYTGGRHEEYLFQTLITVTPGIAEWAMDFSDDDFECTNTSYDDTWFISPLPITGIGDDTAAYRVAFHEDGGRNVYVSNVVLVRQGSMILEVWHSQTDDPPAIEETERLARLALEKSQTALDAEFWEQYDRKRRWW